MFASLVRILVEFEMFPILPPTKSMVSPAVPLTQVTMQMAAIAFRIRHQFRFHHPPVNTTTRPKMVSRMLLPLVFLCFWGWPLPLWSVSSTWRRRALVWGNALEVRMYLDGGIVVVIVFALGIRTCYDIIPLFKC